jgi:hypothetical protein
LTKKHKQWTLDRWSPNSEIFVLDSHVFMRCRVGEWKISVCVVPTVKHGGGGVMVRGCFSGDTVSDLFRIQGILKLHGYHSILQR